MTIILVDSKKLIMKPRTNLYSIALLPPQWLANHIVDFKLNLARKFNFSESLKNFPLITLQQPFLQLPYREEILVDKLKSFAHKHHPIHVQINGFGAFSDHTVYLKMKNPNGIRQLQKQLIYFLKEQLYFSEDMLTQHYLPHLKIATKDIKKDFKNIYADCKRKKFEADFNASAMHLLKYNLNHWEVIASFQFLGVGFTMDLFSGNNSSISARSRMATT